MQHNEHIKSTKKQQENSAERIPVINFYDKWEPSMNVSVGMWTQSTSFSSIKLNK